VELPNQLKADLSWRQQGFESPTGCQAGSFIIAIFLLAFNLIFNCTCAHIVEAMILAQRYVYLIIFFDLFGLFHHSTLWMFCEKAADILKINHDR